MILLEKKKKAPSFAAYT